MDEPRRSRTTVLPSPRGTLTPPSDGALICSSSWRLARFDLRCLPRPAPPLPKAPWVPPRPRPPLPKPPPAGAPPPAAPGAPVPGAPPGRPGPRPPPPGRPAPAGAGRSVRLGIMPGVGRFPPAPAGRRRRERRPDAGRPDVHRQRRPDGEHPDGGRQRLLRDGDRRGVRPRCGFRPDAACPGKERTGCCPDASGRSLSPPRPRGMPWDVANGLLPGRGPPGRGAEPPWRAGAAGVSALGPGRAPGLAPVDGAAGAWAAGAAGAGRRRAAGAAGAAAGAAAAGCRSRGFRCCRVLRRAAGALGAAGPGAGAGRVAAGLADALGAAAGASDFEAAAAAGNALRSFRTTGASMVEEAERTNSPSSCSLVTASLEVIPSSLASSCTRTLATFLLSRSAPSQARTVYFLLRTSAASAAERPIAERNKVVIVAHSSLGTHRVSISFLTRFQVGRLLLRPPGCPRLSCLP